MALYRILRGIHYGETKHLPNSQETNLAALLGDIEPVAEPAVSATPLPPKEPVFTVGTNRNGGSSVFLYMPIGEIFEFAAHPDELNYSWGTWRGKDLRPSKSIVEQYRQAYRAATIPVGPGRH